MKHFILTMTENRGCNLDEDAVKQIMRILLDAQEVGDLPYELEINVKEL